jgi:hypothetical protein
MKRNIFLLQKPSMQFYHHLPLLSFQSKSEILYQSKRITCFAPWKVFSPHHCVINDRKRKIPSNHASDPEHHDNNVLKRKDEKIAAQFRSWIATTRKHNNSFSFFPLTRKNSKHVCRKINIFSLWCLIVSVFCVF